MTRPALIFLLLIAPLTARAQDGDETSLRGAGLGTGPEFLAEYLRQRTRDVIPAEESSRLIGELATEASAVAAAEKLVQRGPGVVVALRRARNDAGDAVLAGRAAKCLAMIEGKPGTELTMSVIRLTGNRPFSGAAEVLLEFAPQAEDATVLEALSVSLGRLAFAEGRPDAKVLAGLTDRRPLIRILAAEALARVDQPLTKKSILPLLKDAVPVVRQRAAIALCKADELEAVPVLVALLADAPKPARAAIEDTLQLLAGETAPRGLPSGDTPEIHKSINLAWDQWWKKIDGPGLLEEFKSRTLAPAEVAGVKDLVQKLGDGNYRTREKATETLAKLGAKVLPYLREAVRDTDGERVRRAEDCIQRINTSPFKRVPSGTPRLTALRRPAGAVEIMLGYLPFIDDDEGIVTEMRSALTSLALDANNKPDAALIKALGDTTPARRSIAAEALCKGAGIEARPAVRTLLDDPVPTVRQAVAVALVSTGEKEAVPTLIDLIGQLPAATAWPALDTLQSLAGETSIPTALSDSPEDRRRQRDLWAAWWKASGPMIDVARAIQGPGYLGHTLLVQVLNNNNGRVVEIGRDGKIRWKIDNLRYPVDAFMLPGDRVLITEWDGNKVTEYDTRGKVIWKKENLAGRATNANRLANGNTFISTTNEMIEVDRTGKEVYKIPVVAGITASYRAANGEIIALRNDGKVVRYNTTGSEIKSFDSKRDSSWTSGLDLVRNGNILVTQPNPGQKVTEFTPDGKIVWEWNAPGVTTATRLPNGNLLAASHGQSNVIEYDRSGKKVWEYKDEYHIFRARRR